MTDLAPDDAAELEAVRQSRTRQRIRVMPCEVYSRIVGYYRPVQGWNAGKRAEYDDRQMTDVKPMMEG